MGHRRAIAGLGAAFLGIAVLYALVSRDLPSSCEVVSPPPRVCIDQRIDVAAEKIKTPVILDPGHGGVDKGATVSEITEDEITYDITVRVRQILLEKGYTVHQTVYDQSTGTIPKDVLSTNDNEALWYPDDRHLLLDRKYLTKRCELINTRYPPETKPLLVSIHVNSASPAFTGASFYFPTADVYGSVEVEEQSRLFAHVLDDAFHDLGVPTYALDIGGSSFDGIILDLQGNPNRKDSSGNPLRLALFDKTPDVKTKVIVETGNLRNASDLGYLLSVDGRQKIAEAIAEGIQKVALP